MNSNLKNIPPGTNGMQWAFYCILILQLFLIPVWMGSGLYNLAFKANRPIDFGMRWTENQYFFKRQNPCDISASFAQSEAGLNPRQTKSIIVDPAIGNMTRGGYPPWAFVQGLMFYWPVNFALSKLVFFTWNALAILVLALAVFRHCIRSALPWSSTLFVLSSVFSASSWRTCLINGQYTILIGLFLFLCCYFWCNNRLSLAGLFLGMALIKPVLPLAHFAYFVFKRERLLLLCTAALLGISSGVFWWWCGVNPLIACQQMLEQSALWKTRSYSLMDILKQTGLSHGAALFLCLGISGLVTLRISILNINRWLVFVLCAMVSRIFFYHLLYDNLLLVPAQLALALAFCRNRRAVWFWIYVIFSLTLWLPGSLCFVPVFQFFQLGLWALVLFVCLYHQPFRDELTGLNLETRPKDSGTVR